MGRVAPKGIARTLTTSNMTNRNIDLPSQRGKILVDPLEIEKPLRRKFRTRNTPWWMWWVAFILVVTASYFIVGKVVDYQANQLELIKRAKASQYSTLCERYKEDAKLSGTSAEETLKQICL